MRKYGHFHTVTCMTVPNRNESSSPVNCGCKKGDMICFSGNAYICSYCILCVLDEVWMTVNLLRSVCLWTFVMINYQ